MIHIPFTFLYHFIHISMISINISFKFTDIFICLPTIQVTIIIFLIFIHIHIYISPISQPCLLILHPYYIFITHIFKYNPFQSSFLFILSLILNSEIIINQGCASLGLIFLILFFLLHVL